jgi:MFS family permease
MSRIRYRVLAFAVALAAVTYLDRVCIARTAGDMMRELGLTNVQMGYVFSAFTIAYALFEIPTRAWGDRIGARRVLTRIVVWWSTFTIATAAAFNYASLLAVRFLFGLGEAGAFPNVSKTFSRWFPAVERGTAQGIFFAGAHLGGGLTPLLVAALLQVMPWRLVFVTFGLVGFVWAAAWFGWFRDEPADHPAVSPSERRYIESGRLKEQPHHLDSAATGWILTDRNVVALCLMYFTQAYGFYFNITWLPTYLKQARDDGGRAEPVGGPPADPQRSGRPGRRPDDRSSDAGLGPAGGPVRDRWRGAAGRGAVLDRRGGRGAQPGRRADRPGRRRG